MTLVYESLAILESQSPISGRGFLNPSRDGELLSLPVSQSPISGRGFLNHLQVGPNHRVRVVTKPY